MRYLWVLWLIGVIVYISLPGLIAAPGRMSPGERLFDLVYRWLASDGDIELEVAQQAILSDYQKSGSKGRLSFMTRGLMRQTI